MDDMTDEQLDRMAWDKYAAAALSGLLCGYKTNDLVTVEVNRRKVVEQNIQDVVAATARIADAVMQQRRAIWPDPG